MSRPKFLMNMTLILTAVQIHKSVVLVNSGLTGTHMNLTESIVSLAVYI